MPIGERKVVGIWAGGLEGAVGRPERSELKVQVASKGAELEGRLRSDFEELYRTV